jgi:hypothetical protein
MPSVRPAAAERSRRPEPPSVSVLCLSLRGAAEIGVLARVVQQLARRSLLPLSWHGTESGEHLLMDLQIAGLGEAEGDQLAQSLRQIVGIEEVLTARILRQRAA